MDDHIETNQRLLRWITAPEPGDGETASSKRVLRSGLGLARGIAKACEWLCWYAGGRCLTLLREFLFRYQYLGTYLVFSTFSLSSLGDQFGIPRPGKHILCLIFIFQVKRNRIPSRMWRSQPVVGLGGLDTLSLKIRRARSPTVSTDSLRAGYCEGTGDGGGDISWCCPIQGSLLVSRPCSLVAP